jgi:hypothetical protein
MRSARAVVADIGGTNKLLACFLESLRSARGARATRSSLQPSRRPRPRHGHSRPCFHSRRLRRPRWASRLGKDKAVIRMFNAVKRFARLGQLAELARGHAEEASCLCFLDGDINGADPGVIHAQESFQVSAMAFLRAASIVFSACSKLMSMVPLWLAHSSIRSRARIDRCVWRTHEIAQRPRAEQHTKE